MTKIVWDTVGEKYYETGVDRGVLYTNEKGVPWNGLISVSENPSGTDLVSYYVDGIKVLDVISAEEFNATIEAYTYPEEFELFDGYSELGNGLYVTNQDRGSFGLSYRTKLGNDVDGVDHGYKLHIVYNAKAAPTNRQNNSLNDSPDAMTFSWDLSTKPVYIPGSKHSAHIIIDSRKTDPLLLESIENFLYGQYDMDPWLPSAQNLIDFFEGDFVFRVVDLGNGMFSVISTDEAITYLTPDTFQLNWPSVTLLDPNTYTATSS